MKQKKRRAEYRYDNRKKISNQRAKRRAEISRQRDVRDKVVTANEIVYSDTALAALKGRNWKTDIIYAQNVQRSVGCDFLGTLIVEYDGVKTSKTYTTIAGFFKGVSGVVAPIFISDSGTLSDTDMVKFIKYDREKNCLFITYYFYFPEQ